jgi:cation:H+ antiporter
MLLLAVAGTLPEIAITVTASLQHHLGLAAGNLLGGIAVQTGVLVICDFVLVEKRPLSFLVGSLVPVVEATLVVALTALAMLGALMPARDLVLRMSPASIAIVLVWLFGMLVINRVKTAPRWEITMPGSIPGRPHRRIRLEKVQHSWHEKPTAWLSVIFLGASIVTLGAGTALALTGSALASTYHIGGIVFGATVLAVVTATPEIASGITAARLGDHQLVMGDIFGGNAFQLTLFLVADLISGKAVLESAGAQNSWLAGLGILVTVVYAMGVIVRPEKNHLRVGADSLIVIALLVLGMIGLTRIN